MPIIPADQVKTEEVKSWTGLHLLHFLESTCSCKVRLALELKGLEWESHIVDVPGHKNKTEWYLGINPLGLVPVLVHDGVVRSESNDIIEYLDETFPDNSLMPKEGAPGMEGARREALEALAREDGLHLDMRALTFSFHVPPFLGRVPPKDLDAYAKLGGEVALEGGGAAGGPGQSFAEQVAWWRAYNDAGGKLPPAMLCEAAGRLRDAFAALDEALGAGDAAITAASPDVPPDGPWLLTRAGFPGVSLVDVAWFQTVQRLVDCGYPFKALHPRLAAWHARCVAQPAFAKQVQPVPPPFVVYKAWLWCTSARLVDVCGGAIGL